MGWAVKGEHSLQNIIAKLLEDFVASNKKASRLVILSNTRQALLISVSDFLFGFVSDTDTDTLNICQTKKTQKNSDTVMLFRGRLH